MYLVCTVLFLDARIYGYNKMAGRTLNEKGKICYDNYKYSYMESEEIKFLKKRTKQKQTLKIIPLGGIGEVGKNMTVIEYGDDIIVIDCGLMFPGEDMLGVDYVIPDTTYLEKNKEKIRAFILTHGHEDHIGATPYVLPVFATVPVYGTRLTLALVELKLSENRASSGKLNRIEPGDKVKCGVFEIEFIKVSHSIDDAVGLAITTPLGVIVHTGDFKVDFTPIDGKIIDIPRFTELGNKGVLALMSDSTNAERPGYTISEKSVGESFEKYFSEATGRIIITTFASNIHRLQQVIDVAKKYNRKVCLTGRSILKITSVAKELGYLDLPEKMLLRIEDINSVRDRKVVILTTGSQGEPMSGLVRMAAGEHARLDIKPGDMVIMSSSAIPGNEKYISNVINMLYRRGATVIYGALAQVHVSGHACQEELKLMLSMVKPNYFIPVHGEYRQIYNHAALAYSMGMNKKDVFLAEIGLPIEFKQASASFGEPVDSGIILIDGLGVGDVGKVVLRDRKLLSQDGLFIVVITVSKERRELALEPEIISRGFVYMKESEDLLEHAKSLVIRTVKDCMKAKTGGWMSIKNKLRRALSSYLYRKTKRSPMILPIVIEV